MSASMTLVVGKAIDQITLGGTTCHMQDSQHGFRKSKSCLTNLISLYDKVTSKVDQGKAVNVVKLDFSKTFSILYSV